MMEPEDMSLEELEEAKRARNKRFKAYASIPYRPWRHEGEEFKPTGYVFKDFYAEHEGSFEPEEMVMRKYVRKLKARGGFTQETAMKALLRYLAMKKEKEIG